MLFVQKALSEAATLHLGSSDTSVQRDVFVYRTYIAMKQYSVVLGEIAADASTPAPLRAVRLLAQHAQGSGSARSSALDGLQQLVQQTDASGFPPGTVHLMAATALAADGRHEDALRCVDPLCKSKNLEGLALRVVVLLAMERRDLASQTWESMQALDDDSSLTQLCGAWISLAKGKGAVTESYDGLSDANLVFKDMADRFGSSALLQNGQAAALMALGIVGDAQPLLADAAGAGTEDAATNSNLVALTYHMGGDAATAEQYVQQARAAGGPNPLLSKFDQAEQQLQQIVDAYKTTGAAATA